MINKIIKDWVGEEKPYCRCLCEKTQKALAVNEYIKDLTSRIPQLTERILNAFILPIEEMLDKEKRENRSMDLYEKSYSEALQDIINTLKGGKEN